MLPSTRSLPGLLLPCLLCLVGAAPQAQDVPPSEQLIPLGQRSWAWIAADETSSNGALLVGDRAALLVDPGLTPAHARRFLAAARAVTDLPVVGAVLTHAHPDHALGAITLDDRELALIAHPLTRRGLAEQGARWRDGILGDSELLLSLPGETVRDRRAYDLGGLSVEVFHPGPAHTLGDLVVWVPDEGVLITGDLLLANACPDLGGGSLAGWIDALDELMALQPEHVVPGHFELSTVSDLARFTDYLNAVQQRTAEALVQHGATVANLAGDRLATAAAASGAVAQVDLDDFADFRQFSQYRATFRDNVAAAATEWLSRPAPAGDTGGFAITARLDVGLAPHQIEFTYDGLSAWIAAAGSDRLTAVDTRKLAVSTTVPAADTPLGVLPLPDGDLVVACFGSDALRQLRSDGTVVSELSVGGAPSLFSPALPGGARLIVSEKSARVTVVQPDSMTELASYPVGRRPFPAAATADGRLAFVPSYDDGTVTVIDLWNQTVRDTITVGEQPSGGAVLPGDNAYAVVVRGENRLVFVNTASARVIGELTDGIGESPFSLVLSADGRLGFVNNTASHDVSVIELSTRQVIARIPVGEIPIAMAVHPSGDSLWVACEGSHELLVVEIPPRWRSGSAAATVAPMTEHNTARATTVRPTTDVAVMGMIHSGHLTSSRWGLPEVRQTIEAFAPDAVLAEIPPDRWQRIWSDYTERGVIEDSRVSVFPEYVDLILELAVQRGFEIVPCAGWNTEMNNLRRAQMALLQADQSLAALQERYAADEARMEAELAAQSTPPDDDPFYIHSAAYDARTARSLQPYDEHLNELIGPGGWTHINAAHMRLVEQAIDERPGQRLLVTFGAGHKHWFLARLATRGDVQLVDLAPFLPGSPSSAQESAPEVTSERPTDSAGETPLNEQTIATEIAALHTFFEDWFVGRLPDEDQAFARFADAMGAGFEIVSPGGTATGRDDLLAMLRAAYASGAEGALRIWTDNVSVRPLGDGLFLARYEEWQESGGETKGRVSSAVLRTDSSAPGGFSWLSVHETWLPDPSDQ